MSSDQGVDQSYILESIESIEYSNLREKDCNDNSLLYCECGSVSRSELITLLNIKAQELQQLTPSERLKCIQRNLNIAKGCQTCIKEQPIETILKEI